MGMTKCADVQPFADMRTTVKMITVAKAYLALTKPRIMLFLLFTAYCAMIVAAGGMPDLRVTFAGLGGLALSAGGSAAVNMWYDRDIDALMERTVNRPIPAGLVRSWHALAIGVGLGLLSVLVLDIWCNGMAAILSLAGYLYYAVVYTIWLKRRTPQNIVIGGGAGAFPPLVGWAAVTGHQSVAAWVMFAVIFLWTPAHFWALALYKNADYIRACVPMMPVVRGSRTTKRQMVMYTVLLVVASWLLAASVHLALCYIIAATAIGVLFLKSTIALLRAREDENTFAKRTFRMSLIYLPVLFAVMVVCVLA
ncbi:heme o synthase [Alicyclobacillus fodiniaquatilis]|uniref:Protoheme IX farnesyltransferase n=1 Tax=Alicyclobacillus fodiniaquatilis TaxID=1661150 RepID=A0ABW4JM68_9BACL